MGRALGLIIMVKNYGLSSFGIIRPRSLPFSRSTESLRIRCTSGSEVALGFGATRLVDTCRARARPGLGTKPLKSTPVEIHSELKLMKWVACPEPITVHLSFARPLQDERAIWKGAKKIQYYGCAWQGGDWSEKRRNKQENKTSKKMQEKRKKCLKLWI